MEFAMLYAVDGALLLLLLLTILRCAHLGLVRSMAGIVAWVAAAAIALHFCAPLAETCYERFLREPVLSMAENYIRSSANKTKDAVTSNSAFSGITEKIRNGINLSGITDGSAQSGTAQEIKLPDVITKATKGVGLPNIVSKTAKGVGLDFDALKKKAEQIPQNSAAALERNLLAPIIKAALKAMLFFALLTGVSGVIRIVLKPVGKVMHKTPVIGTTDRALGAALGLLKGAVLVAVLAMLLRIVSGIVAGDIARAVQNSKIVAFVADSPFADGLFRK